MEGVFCIKGRFDASRRFQWTYITWKMDCLFSFNRRIGFFFVLDVINDVER